MNLALKIREKFKPAVFVLDENQYIKSEFGYVNEDLYEYKTVGELYTLIRTGFENINGLFIGDPNLQVDRNLIDFQDIVKVTDTKSAVTAINKVMEQGEGSAATHLNSHYGIFMQLLHEFEKEKALCGAAFQPVRPAISNPVVHLRRLPVRERQLNNR